MSLFCYSKYTSGEDNDKATKDQTSDMSANILGTLTFSRDLGKKRTNRSYTAAFKLHVVEYAHLNTVAGASRQFGVDEKCIRTWRSQKEILQTLPKNRLKQIGGGRHPKWPELELRLKGKFLLGEGGIIKIVLTA